jgi:hypothetical protein
MKTAISRKGAKLAKSLALETDDSGNYLVVKTE